MSVLMLLCGIQAVAQPYVPAEVSPTVDEYLPLAYQGMKYRDDILSPQAYFGRDIKDHMMDWGDVLSYMRYLAGASERASLREFGKTNQGRTYIQMAVTSPANQARLEDIRLEHLSLTDVERSGKVDLDKTPLVIDLMGSIHGNEASGCNAAIVIAYVLNAADDVRVSDLLDNAVVVITPGLNPDGINRFATWTNTTTSLNHVCDNLSREIREAWPSSRSNHYWADCNRDWLFVQQPEGQNCVAMYRYWMPNVVLDMHEQGNGPKGFYFSPGDPNRTYKYTPQKNQDLTLAIAKGTAAAFDAQGIAYYSGEGYDDYYIGKGAAYGDILGSVCILHEQINPLAYSRPNTAWGKVTFQDAVRNQTIAALSLTFNSYAIKKDLLEYQRNFYREVRTAVAKDPVKAYSFNARGNNGIEFHILECLLRHEIDVYREKGREHSFIVPMNQKNYYTVKALFEDITAFQDSSFYDVSTWTVARAFDLDYKTLGSVPALGGKVEKAVFPEGRIIGGFTNVAYAFGMEEYYAPYLAAALQKEGLRLRVAVKPFTYEEDGKQYKYQRGTIMVPASMQDIPAEEVFAIIEKHAAVSGVDVRAIKTMGTGRHNIGSRGFLPVREARTIILTGRGTSQSESGEVWQLLDKRYNMPHVVVEGESFNTSRLHDYTSIVIAGGIPNALTDAHCKKIGEWVEAGGTLILIGPSTAPMVGKCNLGKMTIDRAGGSNGVILNATLNMYNPLSWGYTHKSLPVYRMAMSYVDSYEDMHVALEYAKEPYLSGCIKEEHIKTLAGAPAILTRKIGNGSLVYISDDINFRSVWYCGSHLLTNAIFFGDKFQ